MMIPRVFVPGSLRCDPCGRVFQYRSQLERHRKSESHCLFAEACLSIDVEEAEGTDISTDMALSEYQEVRFEP